MAASGRHLPTSESVEHEWEYSDEVSMMPVHQFLTSLHRVALQREPDSL
jgi:hypothetical protein